MASSRMNALSGNIPRMKLLATAAAILLAFVAIGCGGEDATQLYTVRGTVTFDGTPVEKGRVLFRKTEGDQRAFSAEIQNGQYELQAEPGPMTVEITASRIIPGKFDESNPDSPPEPVGEMYIPAKYNSSTELTAEVKASSDNEIPFELTSK